MESILEDEYSQLTCVSAYSYLHLRRTERKRTKYSSLSTSYEFIPVAIESLGPIDHTGLEFLQESGCRMSEATGYTRETIHLFQRLSVCTQRFNAVAFSGAFDSLRTISKIINTKKSIFNICNTLIL